MTTNAEKLARELIALRERYSERDFERATDLLLSGKLFSQVVLSAQDAGDAIKMAKQVNRRVSSKSSARLPKIAASREFPSAELDVENILSQVPEYTRAQLITFAKRFQSREILSSGASVRVFAHSMGINFPKAIPSRASILKALLRSLIDLPSEVRTKYLGEADRIANGESSLQRWSDLIVKGDDN